MLFLYKPSTMLIQATEPQLSHAIPIAQHSEVGLGKGMGGAPSSRTKLIMHVWLSNARSIAICGHAHVKMFTTDMCAHTVEGQASIEPCQLVLRRYYVELHGLNSSVEMVHNRLPVCKLCRRS